MCPEEGPKKVKGVVRRGKGSLKAKRIKESVKGFIGMGWGCGWGYRPKLRSNTVGRSVILFPFHVVQSGQIMLH